MQKWACQRGYVGCCGEREIMLGPFYSVELKPYAKCERFLVCRLLWGIILIISFKNICIYIFLKTPNILQHTAWKCACNNDPKWKYWCIYCTLIPLEWFAHLFAFGNERNAIPFLYMKECIVFNVSFFILMVWLYFMSQIFVLKERY